MARGTYGGALDPNIFKVNLRFLMGTSKCQTGFKLRDVAVQDNSAQDVADQVNAVLFAAFKFLLTPRDTFEGVDVLKIGTEEGGWQPANAGAGTMGITTLEETPNFLAANISLKSEIRKRYGQGRMFLPFVAEGNMDGNTINANGVNSINGFLAVMTDNFVGSIVNHDLVLVNSHPAFAGRGAPGQPGYIAPRVASWYDVVSLRTNLLVTSLRSRKAGVGS